MNSSSNEVINITGVGKNPSDIAYNPDNNYIYITNYKINIHLCYKFLLQ